MSKWLVFGVVLAGCGSSGNQNLDGGSDMHHGVAACMPDGQSAQLATRYGVLASLLVNVKVTPDCSGASCLVDADAPSTLLLIADVTQSGQSATITAQPCRIDIPPVALKGGNQPVRLAAPKSLVQSVKPVVAMATLDSMVTCANFNATPITIVLGANLAAITSDPLPPFVAGNLTKLCNGSAATRCLTATTPAPSETGCVCDQEGDGKLGASLDAMNVPGLDDIDKVYTDLRTSVTLTGQIYPAASGQAHPGPRIIGKVGGLKLEQAVLGCHRNLASPATPRDCDDNDTGVVAGFNPAVTQSANGDSTFVAVPLDAADTCDTLIANEASLFQ
jgi:hypothetical protein